MFLDWQVMAHDLSPPRIRYSNLTVTAELLLANVMVVEEFDAQSRGFGTSPNTMLGCSFITALSTWWMDCTGIGVLGYLGACGQGLGIILYGIIGGSQYGWRIMYAVGFMPCLLLTVSRRFMKETKRFGAYPASPACPACAACAVVLCMRRPLHLCTSGTLVVRGCSLRASVACGAHTHCPRSHPRSHPRCRQRPTRRPPNPWSRPCRSRSTCCTSCRTYGSSSGQTRDGSCA
jgi:hypothetical protein